MKRILVVDESQTIRETLRLVLGRDFAVAQRPPISEGHLSVVDEETDLLILGVPPEWGREPSVVGNIVARVSCPVLLLVHSKLAAAAWKGLGRVDFLDKPFNPYELREKVDRLLARSADAPDPAATALSGTSRFAHCLEFPYLPKAAAALAKRYAATALPILILGEAGCGQERVARAIHALGAQAGPWLPAYAPGLTREHLLGRIDQLSSGAAGALQRITLFLGNVEMLHPAGQSSLLEFLEQEEEKGRQFRIFSTSQKDLLEQVYRGEFLGALYYRLATLALRLPPLRERGDDLSPLVASVAREYGERLDLGPVSFSAEAMESLRNYLWFGNLDELATVIARTLATHRKKEVQASDLVLGLDPSQIRLPLESEGRAGPAAAKGPAAPEAERIKEERVSPPPPIPQGQKSPVASRAANGDFPDIKILINELAHELKNPMVTIKTFSQLLGDRFDDAAFRVRFQETVGGDIDRMDELLEDMLDFSRFSYPAAAKIPLCEHLRRVLEEVVPRCIKKEVTIRWGRQEGAGEVFADEAQFHYAFKNVFETILAQVRSKGEIQIDVEGEGRVAVSYSPENGRIGSFARYLDISGPRTEVEEEAFPLRVLLAKILLERNGGGIQVNQLDGGRVLLRAELPVA